MTRKELAQTLRKEELRRISGMSAEEILENGCLASELLIQVNKKRRKN
jgi:hypothetical protein